MISLSPPQTAFCESRFPFVNEWSPIRKLGMGFDISAGLPVITATFRRMDPFSQTKSGVSPAAPSSLPSTLQRGVAPCLPGSLCGQK